MGARKKGRTRFECLGRHYVWWFDNWHVRICSEDKKFVVAYFQGDPFRASPLEAPHLEVHGPEFPGVEPSEKRPVRLLVPEIVTNEWSSSTGAFINALIRWSMQESHALERISTPQEEEKPDSIP